MIDLTKEQIAAYVADPVHCPACQSDNINGQYEGQTGSIMKQSVQCQGCGLRWFEYYQLNEIITAESMEHKP